MTLPRNKSLRIPVTTHAHFIAKSFAQNQPTREKQRQIYHNSLAVCAVKDYLNWMGITSRFDNSDLANPATRLCADVADLEVVGIGRIECRPVTENSSDCILPPETWSDRIGYVVVHLIPPYKEAVLLGFSPTARTGVLSSEQLQSIEDLVEYLSIEHEKIAISSYLSQWLGGVVTEGWHSLEALLGESRLAWRSNYISEMETELTWGKVLDLGIKLGNQSLILLVTLKPESPSSMIIRVRLQPNQNNHYLPNGVALSLISDTGEEIQKIQARNYDNAIQMLPFRGQFQEYFTVKVTLDDQVFQEQFII